MSNYGVIRSLGKEIFEFGVGKNARKFVRYAENGKNWTKVLDHDGNEVLRYSKNVTRQKVGDKFVRTKTTERITPNASDTVVQVRVYDQNQNLLGGRLTITSANEKILNFKWMKDKWSSNTAFSEGVRCFKSFGLGTQNARTNREFLNYNAHGIPIPDLLVDAKGGVTGVNEALKMVQAGKTATANSLRQGTYKQIMQQTSKQLQTIEDPVTRAKATGIIKSLASDMSYSKATPLFEQANAFNPYSLNNVRNLYSQVREGLLLKQPIADVVEKHGKEILSDKMFKASQHLDI